MLLIELLDFVFQRFAVGIRYVKLAFSAQYYVKVLATGADLEKHMLLGQVPNCDCAESLHQVSRRD